MDKKILYTETVRHSGKKILIIHYDDGTKREVVKDPY